MKLAIALLACVGLVAVASTHGGNIADKSFLEKQKFLFEIVYRVEDPLMFEEWIKLSEHLIVDKSYYTNYDHNMETFWEAYQRNALLPRGEFFGNLVESHHKQAWGLFNFFYFAKDWETFQHNVCWARMHVNEGMFVHALTLTVIHRDDFVGLILPYIYEIFPQHFFNSRFVYAAEKFDYNTWSKYIMYEKEFEDIYYKNNKYHSHGDYVYMKDWKMWQWWKLMGLDKHWHSEDNYMLRENIHEFNQDSTWLSTMKDVKMWWMPVDYTRDIDFYNEESALSYFTEDVGWNAHWYYVNMDYPLHLDGEVFDLKKDRRGEMWIYVIQKLIARYYMERLSHGFGEIPMLSRSSEIKYGYKPQLVSYNGIGFSYRKNYYEIDSYENYYMLNTVRNFFQRIEDVVELGYYKMHDGTVIDLRKPESVECWQHDACNIDVFDKYFFNYWYMFSHMYFSEVDFKDVEVIPHVFLNFETMMRDPMFFIFHKKIVDVFFRFKDYLEPYTKKELIFPGVSIKDVYVSELATFFDLVDFDVTNLLNDKMRFVDGKFVWDKTLLARQMRLNHKPFNFEFTIESDKAQKVFIRTYIAPKYDEFGELISLADSRRNFFSIDKFSYELNAGKNIVKRESGKYAVFNPDSSTYTELYHNVMKAYEGEFEFHLNMSHPHCAMPDRLLLPRGWEKGMPMQMFFMVTPYNVDYEHHDYSFSCGIGSGNRFVDGEVFGYPFDRKIDEYEFLVQNMYFKDVKIYHYDNFETYKNNEYKNHGKFDYNFYESYYTKYVKN